MGKKIKKAKYPIEDYINYEMPSEDMDTDIRLYKSHVVKTRYPHKCCYCGADIKKGDDALYCTAIVDGEFGRCYYCIDCVDDQKDFEEGKIDSDKVYSRFDKRYTASHKEDL